MAQRMVIPATAFSNASTKQRRPRERDKDHLKFISSLRCCICGAPGPDAAHIRSNSGIHGKRDTGGGEKPSDKWTVPLCREHHDEQHKGNEMLFWARHRMDPFTLALSLYGCSGDDEVAESIIRSNMKVPR